jgi:hypothetical protein
VVTGLVADLEMRELLDGKRYTSALRRRAESLSDPVPYLAETKWSLHQVADLLDHARKSRRKQLNRQESPIDQ